MFKPVKCLAALGVIMSLLCLCACGGSNVKTEYYTLRALAQTAPETPGVGDLSGYTLALGPVTLPDFITGRAQIIAADGPNKLKLMENARWAEPLDTNVNLVLTDNLRYLLRPDNILQYPWRASAAFDLRVELTVFTLSADHDKAYLRAFYRVTGKAESGPALDGEIDLTAPLPDFTAAGIVAAQNRLFNEASVIIAEKIFQLAERR